MGIVVFLAPLEQITKVGCPYEDATFMTLEVDPKELSDMETAKRIGMTIAYTFGQVQAKEEMNQ